MLKKSEDYCRYHRCEGNHRYGDNNYNRERDNHYNRDRDRNHRQRYRYYGS